RSGAVIGSVFVAGGGIRAPGSGEAGRRIINDQVGHRRCEIGGDRLVAGEDHGQRGGVAAGVARPAGEREDRNRRGGGGYRAGGRGGCGGVRLVGGDGSWRGRGRWGGRGVGSGSSGLPESW